MGRPATWVGYFSLVGRHYHTYLKKKTQIYNTFN